ncbi:hypothetical protein GCM10025867_48100 (plasmid) [Frondihabitans sucicola]|uniref:Uncharacterized protein n=1 Tax=Frondihabitans sucicola TaxID=1268041 RepID=A0ABN6Y664_9MICO|nr:hypothetical protein [Frondihabitans sucicola]BDZ52569.1 hypothetical protein GCM10025867_48100 [Frondihabitans sucicola]
MTETPDHLLIASLQQQLRNAGIEPLGLKKREGDQDLPITNDKPVAHDLVIEDLMARKAVGIQRYGQGLQPFNGRDTLRDIYEEILDSAAYFRALLMMRDAVDADIRDVLTDALGADVAAKVSGLLSDHLVSKQAPEEAA